MRPIQSLAVAPAAARGFSLIELLIVIAILGILLGIGVPNMRTFVVSNRLSSTANEFISALQFARSEALRRNVEVAVERTGTVSGDYSQGWRMMAGGAEIRSGAALGNALSLRASTGSFGTAITFDGSGRLNGAGTIVLCMDGVLTAEGQSRSRAIIVERSGRVRLATLNASQVPVNDSGTAITTCSPS